MIDLLHWVRRGLAVLLVLSVAGIVTASLAPAVPARVLVAAEPGTPSRRPTVSDGELDSILEAIRLAAPFQVDREPAAAFSTSETEPQPTVAAERPTLLLTAIALGADPSAVLEGLPGVEGPRVVRVGDTAGGLAVKAIRNGRVIVVGQDTTWTLTVREPD